MSDPIDNILDLLKNVDLSEDKREQIESYLEDVQDKNVQLEYLVTRLKRDQRINENFVQRTVGMLDKSNEELKEANQKLTRTVRDLKASNEELERFAHIASHDLKTPLHNIIRFTGLLEMELEAEEDSLIAQCLTFIKEGGHRMNTLMDDLLEYSKLSKKNVVTEIVSIEYVTDNILSSISAYIEEKNAKVTLDPYLPTVRWNYTRIFLLIKNMIENGIKYNQTEVPKIHIFTEEIDKETYLCIEDNGIGISQEYHDKVFDMFNRLHNANEYSGTGLGLSTCLKIVQEFDGEIKIESKVDIGTVFKIKLPTEILVEDANICPIGGPGL